MIPRKRIDIGWSDLAFGVAASFLPGDAERAKTRIERTWDDRRANLACLSVRSGFDALLGALDFPSGSEILVSAVTIRDMARIIEAHGLVAVPVDIDPRSLAVLTVSLEAALTPRTRGVLVAHLFGSRMTMAGIAGFSAKNNLLLIEDCAQAYTGDVWRGDPGSDVTMFSFGPIKTATALGGAMLGFRDAALRDRVDAQQSAWPVQNRASYLLRLFKYALIVALGHRVIYGAFVGLCRLLGADYDRVLAASVRGFAGGDFLRKIRRRASLPLLRLLQRRIAQGEQPAVGRRVSIARLAQRISGVVGADAEFHSYWVCPIRHSQADSLIKYLLCRGFDATRGASSMCLIAPPAGRARAREAEHLFAEMLYLPLHESMSACEAERLVREVESFGKSSASGQQLRSA